MNLQAKVANRFKETEHNGHIYQPGDTYPANGYEADPKRVEFLATVHPVYNKIYLADIQEVAGTATEFPKHVGGGTYELSNGEKVKGKEEAVEAEKALKE